MHKPLLDGLAEATAYYPVSFAKRAVKAMINRPAWEQPGGDDEVNQEIFTAEMERLFGKTTFREPGADQQAELKLEEDE